MQPLKLTMTAIRSSLTGHGRQADGLVDLVAGAEDLIHVEARVVLLKTPQSLGQNRPGIVREIKYGGRRILTCQHRGNCDSATFFTVAFWSWNAGLCAQTAAETGRRRRGRELQLHLHEAAASQVRAAHPRRQLQAREL